MSNSCEIESRPDEYWMNVVEHVTACPNPSRPDYAIEFLSGVNCHWPSLWRKPSGRTIYNVWLEWDGKTVDAFGPFFSRAEASWWRELFLKGRLKAFGPAGNAPGRRIIISQESEMTPGNVPRAGFHSFDPMI